MRILICRVLSTHVSREGGDRGRSPAGCSQSLVRGYKSLWGTESLCWHREGAQCSQPKQQSHLSQPLIPARIDISVSKQFTI